MRETCARVLAAALMTGAIAFAVGMPALFGTAHDLGRSVLAPPSSLQRTIRVPAPSAPQLRTGALRTISTSSGPAQRTVIARPDRNQLTSSQSPPQRRPGAGKPAPKPKPKPGPTPQPKPEPTTTPQVGTRELASSPVAATRPAEPASTRPPAERSTQHLHANRSKGKAKGHDQRNGKGPTPTAEPAQPTSTATATVSAATAPASSSCQPESNSSTEHWSDNGQGQGKGHGDGSGDGNSGRNGHGGDQGNGNGQGKEHEG